MSDNTEAIDKKERSKRYPQINSVFIYEYYNKVTNEHILFWYPTNNQPVVLSKLKGKEKTKSLQESLKVLENKGEK